MEIELDLMNIITKIPKEAVKVRIDATIYHDGKLQEVRSEMTMGDIECARQDFLDNVEDGDEYDTVYVITEEGRRWLDEMQLK